MIRLLFRSKRGLSPVVSALFLFVIIFVAIAVSLGIIYPNLDQLDETISLETAAASFLSIDSDLKEMMLSGGKGKTTKLIDIGLSGLLIGDNSSKSSLNTLLIDDGGIVSTLGSPFSLDQSRIIIQQSTDQNVLNKNTVSYISGSGFQDLYFLNSSKKSVIPWTMIVEKRFQNNFVYTMLTYRNIMTIDRTVVEKAAQLEVNLTISIQSVKFNFVNHIELGSTNPTLTINYQGINSTTTPWLTPILYFDGYRWIKVDTSTALSLNDEVAVNEQPLTHEVTDELNIRYEFVTHIFDISF
ncbi:MAG: hypothetical protein ACXAB7_13930 [Candidatus Kariarchaeaceae archaeon]|jgi:hypothetical protein